MLTLLRRATLFAGAAAVVLPATRKVAAQTAPVQPGSLVADPSRPFVLPPLPYATAANEPAIDAQTMERHHDKHHAAYVRTATSPPQ